MTPVFDIRGLTKIYAMGETVVRALRGVNLRVEAGELIVLLGPSGSGKSTFLNIVGGLDVPSEGQVIFQGRDLSSLSEDELTFYRRRHVGFVFQAYNLVPSLTAKENIDLVTEITPNPLSSVEALSLVGLGERINHFPAQLSGGEQQRVAIARAIAKRPAVLLCDEPTGALDHTTGIVVLEAIADVNQRFQTTTMIITHNAAIAAMADRVLHFADGRIAREEKNATRAPASQVTW